MKTVLTFLFVFCVIVIVHELGHFIFAKRSGILVREFAIGMGPKIFAHTGKDGTTYTIRLLPIGGYVRMAGMGEEEVELTPGQPIAVELNDKQKIVRINTSSKIQLSNAIPLEVTQFDLEKELIIKGHAYGNDKEVITYEVEHDAMIIESDGTEVRIAPLDVQFQSAKLYKRALTNFAGPLFNFILTFIIFTIVLFIQGGNVEPDPTSKVGAVVENGVAADAGIKPNDRIIEVAGKRVTTFEEIGPILTKNVDKSVKVKVERDGKEKTVTLTPRAEKQEDGSKRVMMGIMGGTKVTSLSFIEKLKEAGTKTIVNATVIFVALKDLILGFSLNKLGGPVMIFQVSSQVANEGIITILNFMAMLSVNLGIMNLLPIPALDGGKLLLNFVEAIRRKPLSEESEGKITMIGFAFMMILMVLVTWNDIMRFFFR
ncbi:RIP metalloprotease RseP [Vagococcus intermedius]|uniref:Zinc metalloprotease n=1 Tax=Vagococcus intermedius TaxID=2991418 RepID=A0AAF0I556_9ENTE|nr:RIP metalloprotease RseP [Vagococcus intermedius]WEG72763.1 RIP metalloprotease RseP [Vagococcus intermedius]WEG74849.1 RIP metalloprotease RseP [Vagococcus intermedius]